MFTQRRYLMTMEYIRRWNPRLRLYLDLHEANFAMLISSVYDRAHVPFDEVLFCNWEAMLRFCSILLEQVFRLPARILSSISAIISFFLW